MTDVFEDIQKQNDLFVADIVAKMTYARARLICDWHDLKYSDSEVADEAHSAWGTDALWMPPSNSVAGKVLIDVAQNLLKQALDIKR